MKPLLELSIRTSSSNNDPFKDDITCELNSYSLNEQIFAMQNIRGAIGKNGYINEQSQSKLYSSIPQSPNLSSFNSTSNFKCLESITLDYMVKWPLTLIISRRSITKYQLIFRHLFFCKYVERHLAKTWLLHQKTKEQGLDVRFSHLTILVFVSTLLQSEAPNASFLQKFRLLFSG